MSLTKIICGAAVLTGISAATLTYQQEKVEEIKNQPENTSEYIQTEATQPEIKVEVIHFEPLEIVGNPNKYNMLEKINYNNSYKGNIPTAKKIYTN